MGIEGKPGDKVLVNGKCPFFSPSQGRPWERLFLMAPAIFSVLGLQPIKKKVAGATRNIVPRVDPWNEKTANTGTFFYLYQILRETLSYGSGA